jgi:hypothetical protein
MKKMMKKIKVPENINWILDAREQQIVELLFRQTGIDQGTQLVKSAVTRWYNDVAAEYYAKYGKEFGLEDFS